STSRWRCSTRRRTRSRRRSSPPAECSRRSARENRRQHATASSSPSIRAHPSREERASACRLSGIRRETPGDSECNDECIGGSHGSMEGDVGQLDAVVRGVRGGSKRLGPSPGLPPIVFYPEGPGRAGDRVPLPSPRIAPPLRVLQRVRNNPGARGSCALADPSQPPDTMTADPQVTLAPVRLDSLYDIVVSGGILMWPIAFCSVVALAYVVERSIRLRDRELGSQTYGRAILD